MGKAFQVNTYETGYQHAPVLVPSSDGGFLVIWKSVVPLSGIEPETRGQFYDPDGLRIGEEFILTEDSAERGAPTAIAALTDGEFALIWAKDGDIWIAIYDDHATLRVQPFLAADGDALGANLSYADLTVTHDGGFVLSFRRMVNYEYEYFVRVFTPDGVAEAPPIRLAEAMPIREFEDLDTVVLDDGTMLSAWFVSETWQIEAEIRHASGAIIRSDLAVDSYSSEYVEIELTLLKDGNVLMVESGEDAAPVIRFVSPDGTLLGPADGYQKVNLPYLDDDYYQPMWGTQAWATQLDSGEIVIVWDQTLDQHAGPGDDDLFAVILSETGDILTDIFEIHPDGRYVYDESSLEDFIGAVDLQALEGGGFIITAYHYGFHSWEGDPPQDVDDEGIFARIYGRGTMGDDVLDVDASGRMAGLDGNDSLSGNAGRNRLDGGAGNDRLIDFAGSDTLIGGAGDDTLRGGLGQDTLDGGAGQDTALFVADTDIRVDLNDSRPQETGQGRDVLIGIEHVISAGGDDWLKGDDAANALTGHAGDDLLTGRNGADTLVGSAGRDSLQGDNGDDLLLGGLGSDTAIYTGASAVRVDLSLTTPQDTGRGTDQLMNIENVIGGSGDDALLGDPLDNRLDGSDGNDRLRGYAGKDVLVGGGGDDRLFGGNGDDVLLGARGDDLLVGNAGADTFLFTALSGRDRILDFDPRFDVIQIDVADTDAPGVTVDATAAGALIAWQGGSVLVKDVTPEQLGSDVLIFV